MQDLSWAFASIALATWIICLASIAVAGWRIGSHTGESPLASGSPPVTIIRPLCGRESFSEETLQSGFEIDYPRYELLFCVASSADPIIRLVEQAMTAHPHIRSRLLVGDDRVSDNPKLNNCFKGWHAAQHDWIVLADSNVLMPKDYIARMLTAWRPSSGLVCSTPIGSRPSGFWALVECAFLNTLQARWQYAGEAVGFGFAQGKSMLWWRPLLEEHGGIRALAAEIAEDAAATKLVRAAGLAVHLVDRPFEQPLGQRRLGEVWARQLRWARLRRVTFPLFFAPEILSGALLPALALGLAFAPASAGAAAALCVATWYGAEAWLARRAGWHLTPAMIGAFFVRDAMIPALWLTALMARNIVWRGNAMDIRTHASTKFSSLRRRYG